MVRNDFSGNPFQIGGMPSAGQMNQQFGGGFRIVSPQQMALNAIGRGGSMFGRSRRSGLPMPFGDDEEPGGARGGMPGEEQEPKRGISEKIRAMLTGGRGAAIGGAAQAAGDVIGAYIASQPARARQKEEERRARLQEQEGARIRDMLMPLVQSQLERQKRIQEEEDRRRQAMGYGG